MTNMNTLTATIEFAQDNCTIYIREVDGVYGIGATVEEAKLSLEESISLTKETCIELGEQIPEPLQNYSEIKYSYDLGSFLNIYGGILSKAGLEKLTGINQKQLWHYASGISKPRPETVKKIADSIHKFAETLSEVEFA